MLDSVVLSLSSVSAVLCVFSLGFLLEVRAERRRASQELRSHREGFVVETLKARQDAENAINISLEARELSTDAITRVGAMERSTHSIQYVDPNLSKPPTGAPVDDNLDEDPAVVDVAKQMYEMIKGEAQLGEDFSYMDGLKPE